jgi:CheY-like chemotaxis protein
MGASPLPQGPQVILFGHDPTVISDRCAVLRSAGYRTVVTTTAREAESLVAAGGSQALLIGSQTGPLTRLRLADIARNNGMAVVHIAYHNHPEPRGDEIYVTRPLGPKELLDAMSRALSHLH